MAPTSATVATVSAATNRNTTDQEPSLGKTVVRNKIMELEFGVLITNEACPAEVSKQGTSNKNKHSAQIKGKSDENDYDLVEGKDDLDAEEDKGHEMYAREEALGEAYVQLEDTPTALARVQIDKYHPLARVRYYSPGQEDNLVGSHKLSLDNGEQGKGSYDLMSHATRRIGLGADNQIYELETGHVLKAFGFCHIVVSKGYEGVRDLDAKDIRDWEYLSMGRVEVEEMTKVLTDYLEDKERYQGV